jgi:predicted nucleic acid-binding protein
MKRAVLADAGPLYAAADPDDAHHDRAQRELKRLARDKREVFLAYPTLAEAYTLVLRRLGNETAANWLNSIVTGPCSWIQRPKTAMRRSRRSWSSRINRLLCSMRRWPS